ncbi:hypothetical protein [Wolbachia endosymbiont of Mansonella perstans]|uniref:hypothetical protein n=1 Tax=Wolbachia endosymbiont of Mansonella perstans TaxID=229526 RepID=UPI001CE0BCF4|nr:hypothetical protein [Wolbachia endosymbiont of Mansonella perstans]MCA4774253.1 hypothetical protein [Wolbachia endosymbiont of Mansonella perstans]
MLKRLKKYSEIIQSKIEAKTRDLVTEEALKTTLKAKADKKYVDEQLAEKADASTLRAKAEKTEIVPTVLKLPENDVKQLKQFLGLQEQVA